MGREYKRAASPKVRGRSPRLAHAALSAPLVLGLMCVSLPTAVRAQSEATLKHYQIGAGPLGAVLAQYGRDAGILLTFVPELTAGKSSPGLTGSYSVQAGLDALLASTGLRAAYQGGKHYSIARATAAEGTVLEAVTVVGGALSGPPPAYAGGLVARGGRVGVLGDTDIMDTPYSQVSFTSELMQNQQARSIADVVQNDPSVRLTDAAGSGMEQSLLIRGFSQNGTATYFNGLYGVLPPYLVSADLAERVEVLKGPNAMLYGMTPFGGLGGSINVVPKRAGDTPLARAGVNYASDGQVGGQVDVGRRFGDSNEFGLRFNGAYRNGATAIDAQRKLLSLATLGLDYAGDRFRLSADVIDQRNRTTNPRTAMTFASADIPSAPRASGNPITGGEVDYRDTGLVARAEYDLRGNLTFYAAAGESRGRYSVISPVLVGAVAPDGSFQGRMRGSWLEMDREGLDVGLRGRFNTGPVQHKAMLGYNRVAYTTRISTYSNGPLVSGSLYDSVHASVTRSPKDLEKTSANVMTSYTLADTLSALDERVQLTVGVRHQNVDSRTYQRTGGLSGPAYDESAWTPTYGLLVKPWQNVSVYANYIQGLAQGSRVTDPAATNFGAVFPPYKTEQYEAGVKWDLGDIGTTLSVFQISQPSLLSYNNGVGGIVYREDGEQRNRGVEWNVFGKLTPALSVLGGLAYTDATLVSTAAGANNGNRAPGVARWQGSLGLDWDIAALPGFAVSGRAIYTGPAYLNAANTQKIGSWVRYDVGARWRTRVADRELVVRANVENLLNKSYWVANGSGGAGMNSPRVFMLSASMDF